MAAANINKARKRPRVHRLSKSISKSKTILGKPIPEPVRKHLFALVRTLRDIEGTMIVATGALREGNEFTGPYVAYFLRQHVGNRLSLEADRVEVLLGLKQHEDDSTGAGDDP